MITNIKRPIPDSLVLLTTTNNAAEYEIISRMLDSNGIDVYIIAEGESNVAGLVIAPIPQYSFYVHSGSLSDAQNLLLTAEQADDKDWREYRERLAKKGAFGGRIIGCIFALFLLILAFLPMRESDNSMRYVLFGASLLFFTMILFSFKKK